MYEGTPSFVADRLTALFDKKSRKKEILRIEDEIERLGFDQFSNFAFDAEYFDLPTTELIPATADIFFCISEYYFEDEELIALQYLWKAIVSGLDQHLNQTAWKALWELTDDLLIEASRSGKDFGTANDRANEVSFPGPAGTFLMHHAKTIHWAGANHSATRSRRALGFIYYAKRAKPDLDAARAYQKRLDAQLKSTGKI